MTNPPTQAAPTTDRPSAVERPRTVTEAASLLRESSGSVLLRGGATKLDWGGPVESPGMVLDTTELIGVLTHNPADMTASVRAGTPLTRLQAHLADSEQWLALDPPTAGRGATVGGLLAAGDSGPSRLRYGGLRDLVIGATLVLADGQVARSGGHVIKNVAGYDLAKLVYGSLGTLALVAEVVVRLHPLPRDRRTLIGPADPGQATAAALAIAVSPLEPAALEWVSDPHTLGRSGRLLVRVDGSASHADQAADRMSQLLAAHGIRTQTHAHGDESSQRVWDEQAAAVLGDPEANSAGSSATGHETVVRVCGLPSDFTALATQVSQLADDARMGLEVASSLGLGIHTMRLIGPDLSGHARLLTATRDLALGQGASVLTRSRPDGLDALVDPLGPAPGYAPMLARIKAQFDPDHRLAPGRLAPWA
ncbi:MAG: FAD-binding oxidoreductase [Humibacillus sp.]|nr:FAD-binding oxidoreductase [Humibacillus sp.]MDN5778772.1 FAD-binding oxidoreductase [Humibacillus sp.]